MPKVHFPGIGSRAIIAALLVLATAMIGAPAQAQTAAPAAPANAGTAAAPTPRSDVITVQDLCRVQGHGESVLRGIGLVTGLTGTGDAGSDEVLARPLAEVYRNNNLAFSDLRALAKSKSVAIVALEVIVPEGGAKSDDKLDVHVTVMHSASSLVGGRLLIGPLTGPYKGDPNVWAMASGPIEIESKTSPTAGRVRGGARIVRDIMPAALGASFDLICHPDVRGWAVTNQLADAINALQPDTDIYGDGGGLTPPIARAMDEATVRVDIPVAERANPARFVSKVLTATFSPTLLKLPAQVIVNARTGCIIVTGNVEISAVAIAHKDLVINSTQPPPVPTPAAPITMQSRATSVGTTGRTSDRARIEDLLEALKAMDVPVEDQIAILTQIQRTGRLHARLIID
ncbi:MAG: flagellar basal body P-ring protein FlgI [Phycisphaerales bacterium]